MKSLRTGTSRWYAGKTIFIYSKACKVYVFILMFATAAFYASFLYMLYRQCIVGSDISAHIDISIKRNVAELYSLFNVLTKFIYVYTGRIGIVLGMLALSSLLTIYATWYLLYLLVPKCNIWFLCLMAWACNFEGALYIAGINGHYKGVQAGSIWSNPTYILMKLFATVSIIFYVKLSSTYLEKIHWLHWVFFSASLAISTYAKPSFLLVFAPIMALFLLVDLVKTKGKKFKSVFLFGCAVLPSVGISLLQSILLFDQNNSFTFAFMKLPNMYSEHPYIGILQSLAFPLAMSWLFWAELKKSQVYLVSLGMAVIGYFLLCCVAETGSRAGDGNFGWSSHLCVFFFFVVTCAKLCSWMQTAPYCVLSPLEKKVRQGLIFLFLCHAASGVLYYSILVPYPKVQHFFR